MSKESQRYMDTFFSIIVFIVYCCITHVNVFLRINFIITTSAGKVRYVALYPLSYLSTICLFIHPSTNDT